MKVGYSTWGMPTTPIDVSLQQVAALGFDAVELTVLPRYTTALANLDSAERRRVAGLLKTHGLLLSAVGAYLNLIEQDPDAFARHRDYVRLPLPDSPTRPKRSPLCRVKVTPSTAFTGPASVW